MASQGKNKTNFKTYEASIRLLAAVIATTNAKLDYAELAKHVGGGSTKDAINHRLRPIKQLAKMQAACVSKGEDPGDLPADKGALADLVGEGTTAVALQHRMRPIKQLAKEFTADLEKKNPGKSPVTEEKIQKLFGESTPSGIEWQFREIKSLGKAQQEAVRKNENPATLLVAGTPGGRKRGAAASTPGSGTTARTPGTGARSRKRTAPTTIPAVDSSEENGDNDSDGDFVETPSKRPTKRAKAKATATATTTTSKQMNGSVTTPSVTPAKTTAGTPTPTPAVSTVASATRTTNSSIFGGDAGASGGLLSNEVFHGVYPSMTNNLQYHSHAANPATRQTPIKKEFPTEINPFLAAVNAMNSVNAGAFDDFEDGEI